MTAVTLSGVSKTFASGTQALAATDIVFPAGSFTAVVGPSGCGKSTLLKLIAGLAAPSSGTIARNPAAETPGAIGFVFQDPTLMPWQTVRGNAALPLRLSGFPAAEIASRTDQALSLVALSDFAAAYPRELSGGMKMRTSIARALITRPGLLLMDEPFAALDEFTRFRLNDDLLSLWRTHKWTAIFVTHSIREAVFLAERVLVMSPRPGRVIADLRISLPPERNNLRDSHAFADECARVTAALQAEAAA